MQCALFVCLIRLPSSRPVLDFPPLATTLSPTYRKILAHRVFCLCLVATANAPSLVLAFTSSPLSLSSPHPSSLTLSHQLFYPIINNYRCPIFQVAAIASMAPGAGRATAADEQWLSLRRRHDAELRDFQQQVQEQKKVFLQNVEQARAKLLADHADQEKLFWTESGRSATVGAKRVAASKTDVQSSTRKHSTAPAAQVPIANSATLEAGQTPRSVQPQLAAVPSAPRPANKKAAVAYIDLCSDDDEPIVLQTKPASTFATTPILAKSESLSSTEVDTAATHEAPIYPIPSANLELFGSNSKTFQVSSQFLTTGYFNNAN
jgi:hypothetical protein